MIGVRVRRAAVMGAIGLVLAASLALVGQRSYADEPTSIGIVGNGRTAFTFVGKIEQNGALADDVGYLTAIDGLDEQLLFSGGNPLGRTESTARFAYFATATLQTRSINGNVFVTAGTATTTLYFNVGGGASFDDLTSFKQGTVIATYESHWQDIVNVQSPNQGVATVVSDETQISATPFTLQGTQYVLGREGLQLRLAFSGEGTRTDPTLPRATILYGGQAVSGAATNPSTGASESASPSTSMWTWVTLALAAVALLVAVGAAVRRTGRRSPNAT